MIGTVAWLALAAAAVALELASRSGRGWWPSLAVIGAGLWSRPVGRGALIAMWAFVGWHVFARYTVPA